LLKNGFNKAILTPFLLVSGYHFQKDINGEEQSWKNVFQQNGIRTRAIDEGLGENERIIALFGRHIREALDIIPANNR
jgi:sirohydrochlorin cobaltochelatase